MEIGEQPALRHYDVADRTRNRFTGQVDVVPNDAVDRSAPRAGVGRTTTTTATSGCRNRRFRLLSLAATSASRTVSVAAGATTTSATRGCSGRDRRARADQAERSDCGTGPPTRPSACTTSPCTRRLRRSGANTEARCRYDLQLRRGKLPLHGRARRPLPAPSSSRTFSTSCSSCTST